MGRLLDIPIMDPPSYRDVYDPLTRDRPDLRTYQATDRAYYIIRDLTRAADLLRRSMLDRSPYVALTIRYEDWRLLMVEMPMHRLRDYFGPEGAAPSFMGLPLLIQRDARLY